MKQYELGCNERNCLDRMLDTYKIVLGNTDENKSFERSVTCALIKDFLGYCYIQDQISDEDYAYIQRQNIIDTLAGHKAFYDILCRKFIN